jgi:hypothetical protein
VSAVRKNSSGESYCWHWPCDAILPLSANHSVQSHHRSRFARLGLESQLSFCPQQMNSNGFSPLDEPKQSLVSDLRPSRLARAFVAPRAEICCYESMTGMETGQKYTRSQYCSE